MRLVLLAVVAALVVGVSAGGPASALGKPMGQSAAHQKKRKAVRCHKNQVPIKVRRRTVGCRSLRAALPAPRAGDPLLVLANSVLDDDKAIRDGRDYGGEWVVTATGATATRHRSTTAAPSSR